MVHMLKNHGGIKNVLNLSKLSCVARQQQQGWDELVTPITLTASVAFEVYVTQQDCFLRGPGKLHPKEAAPELGPIYYLVYF